MNTYLTLSAREVQELIVAMQQSRFKRLHTLGRMLVRKINEMPEQEFGMDLIGPDEEELGGYDE